MTDLQQSFLNAFHTLLTLRACSFDLIKSTFKQGNITREEKKNFPFVSFLMNLYQLYLYLSTLYSLMSIVFPSNLMIVQTPPHFHYFLLDFSYIYKSFLLHCSRIILTSSHVLRRVKRYTRVLCVRWCECLSYF